MSLRERLLTIVKGRPKPLEENLGAPESTTSELRAGRERKPESAEQPRQLNSSTLDNIVIACGVAMGCGICWLISWLRGGL